MTTALIKAAWTLLVALSFLWALSARGLGAAQWRGGTPRLALANAVPA